jgi:hypothetical protein
VSLAATGNISTSGNVTSSTGNVTIVGATNTNVTSPYLTAPVGKVTVGISSSPTDISANTTIRSAAQVIPNNANNSAVIDTTTIPPDLGPATPLNVIKSIQPDLIASIPSSVLKTLTAKQLSVLSPSQITMISKSQIDSLGTEQLRGLLEGESVAALSKDASDALKNKSVVQALFDISSSGGAPRQVETNDLRTIPQLVIPKPVRVNEPPALLALNATVVLPVSLSNNITSSTQFTDVQIYDPKDTSNVK